MKVRHVFLVILWVFHGFSAFSQELTPPIQNHSSVDYAAASQNWDVTLSDEGIVYVANNEGLLSYDGQRWELFRLKSGSIIRSVYAQGDRVYTGSYKEFGYWSRQKNGRMLYTSLMPLMKDYPMQSEEFWEILSHKGAIYFRSFGAIYRYKNDKIESVKRVVSNEMVSYQNRLLLGIESKGIFFLEEDNSLNALPGQDFLDGKRVMDMEVLGKDLLIGTKDAIYRYQNGQFESFGDKKLNSFLKLFELNRLEASADGNILIGTVKNGLIHYNLLNQEMRIYNRNSGLQNNTVLGIAEKRGRVWLGLDNGVDEMQLDSPVKFYSDRSGELGAVYDLIEFEGSLYIASNTGVYFFKDREIQLVQDSQGHCWNLEILDNRLYANHNSGIYLVEDGVFVPVDQRTGSFCFQTLPGQTDRFLVGTYTGISLFSPKTGEIEEIKEVRFPVKKLLIEDKYNLWAEHPYEGAYRLSLDPYSPGGTRVQKITGNYGQGSVRANVFLINNQVALLRNEKWYRYNSFRDNLEAFEELESLKGHRMLLEDRDAAWFVNENSNALVYTDFRGNDLNLTFNELNKRLVKGSEKIIKQNDSIFFVALNDGFARVDLQELRQSRKKDIPGKIILKGLQDGQSLYDLSEKASIPFKNARNITVRAALPGSDSYSLKYELDGEDRLKGNVNNGVLRFHNLQHGDYELNLFGLGPQNERTEVNSLKFRILPPWYLSSWMKLVYFMAFLSLLALIYLYNRTKLKKHRKLIELKFEKEHQERINRMEKERLRNEINLKRKELANTTMVAAKKNEVLMEIQGELSKDKDKFSNQFRLKHIMNKINQAVKSKDEWKVFETNFSEVHEDFFRDLLEKYPNLSNKDLKLCSYLKMNLTSKEIAPLMGISVRGVEVHRYRLRKKMDLDSSENLTNFFIKNF